MHLTLVLTRACNLACRYCYAGDKFNLRMDVSLARQAITWAMGRHTGPDPFVMGYFGGEPLLAWDLLTQFHAIAKEIAGQKGIPLRGTVTTNGTLLTPERMAWLQHENFNLGLSIDGDRQAHDRLRLKADGSSSFDAVLAGLETALAVRPLTQTISVIDPGNVDLMAQSVQFLLQHGVRVLSLSPNYTAQWSEQDLETFAIQLSKVADIYADSFRNGHDIYISTLDAKIMAHIKGGLAECDRCAAGLRELALAPSGTWYPCERLVGNDGPAERVHALGNAHERNDGGPDPLRVLNMTRHRGELDPTCSACPINTRCMNHCACSNIMSGGDYNIPGGLICRLEQIAIHEADRVAAMLFAEGCPTFVNKQYRPALDLIR
jgi:uncharacterized protein